MLEEIWMPVKESPSYLVSNLGQVKSPSGKVLSLVKHSRGYLTVKIRSHKLVHVLVLEAFISQRPIGMEVDHINSIKTDNRLVNLEWVTHKENIRRARHRKGRKINREQAMQIKNMNGLASPVIVGKLYGLHHKTVRQIWAGEIWKSLADTNS